MRKIKFKIKGTLWYDCYILVDDDLKLILKIDCTCWNFQNRRIKNIGSCAYKKHYAEPCKHLKPFTCRLEKMGYKLKIPKMEGTNRPTKELKDFLLDRSKGICERTYCNKDSTDIHRRIPGIMGGKYSKENCVFICNDCHKLVK